MKFGFATEGDTHPGTTHQHRYLELIDEVLLAEKVGFDKFGTSEQHFAVGEATVSAPEVLYPYLMALTSRIRFVHKTTLLPTRINHPLRVAERVATQDLLSHGRIELGFGRGNTTLTLRGFGVSPEENKSQLLEGIDLIKTAFTNDPFSFVGEHYQVPPRTLIPKCVQDPHPPLMVAAGSSSTFLMAAEKGIGVLCSPSFRGLDAIVDDLQHYDKEFDRHEHGPGASKNKGMLVFGYHCADTTEQAIADITPAVKTAALATDAYGTLAKLSKDYAYKAEIKAATDRHAGDPDYLLKESGSFIAGDPEECVRQLRKVQELGIDDVWLRIDSMPHDKLMRSIELTGKYVIPQFRKGSHIVRSSDEVIQEIREMRPEHERRLAEFQAARGLGESAAGATVS